MLVGHDRLHDARTERIRRLLAKETHHGSQQEQEREDTTCHKHGII